MTQSSGLHAATANLIPKCVLVAGLLGAFFPPLAAHPSPSSFKSIRVNGVVLHYIDQGRGTPLIFVHGGPDRGWLMGLRLSGHDPAILAILAVLAISFIYPVADAPMSEMWR